MTRSTDPTPAVRPSVVQRTARRSRSARPSGRAVRALVAALGVLLSVPLTALAATPAISVTDAAVTEADSTSVQLSFVLRLSTAGSQTITVAWSTRSATATAPADYVAASGTATFFAGQTTVPVRITAKGDVLDEHDETLQIVLASPTNATIADGIGVGTIRDNDALPALRVADASVREGDSGTSELRFLVTVSPVSGRQVSVAFATEDASTGVRATAGTDYTAARGTLTIPAGHAARAIVVPVLTDALREADETLAVRLSTPAHATVADASALGTIRNDDNRVDLRLAVADTPDPVAVGRSLRYTLTVTNGGPDPAPRTQVRAEIPAGMTYVSGTVSGGSCSRAAAVLACALGSLPAGAARAVTLTLLPTTTGMKTLRAVTFAEARDRDPLNDTDTEETRALPGVSVADLAIDEGTGGSRTARFVIRLSAPATGPVSIPYATSFLSGTGAATTADLSPRSGTVSLVAGEREKVVLVPIVTDAIHELDERFAFGLGSISGSALMVDGTAIATIRNDDEVPTIQVEGSGRMEGAAPTVAFEILLSNPSYLPITVDYATVAGTATAGRDYTPVGGRATFQPGERRKAFSVPIANDTSDERPETFTVRLSAPTNASLAVEEVWSVREYPADGSPYGIASGPDGRIWYTEYAGNAISRFSPSTPAVRERSELPRPARKPSAIAPGPDATMWFGEEHYPCTDQFEPSCAAWTTDGPRIGTVTLDGTVTELPGERLVAVGAMDAGPDEDLFIGTIEPGSQVDSELVPGVVRERQDGRSVLHPDRLPVGVAYGTGGKVWVASPNAEGFWASGPDGTGAGPVALPGYSGRHLAAGPDGNLWFTTGFSGVIGWITAAAQLVNAVGAPGTARTDDITLGPDGLMWVTDGGTPNLHRVRPVFGFVLSVPLPSATSRSISITSGADGDLWYTYSTGSPSEEGWSGGIGVADLARSEATIRIGDDDARPSIGIADASVAEPKGTQREEPTRATIRFDVSLSAPAGRTVTVRYATEDQTATADVDYLAASGTVTFAPGEQTKSIDVTVLSDGLRDNDEEDEAFVVRLSSPTAATLADDVATGTIVERPLAS